MTAQVLCGIAARPANDFGSAPMLDASHLGIGVNTRGKLQMRTAGPPKMPWTGEYAAACSAAVENRYVERICFHNIDVVCDSSLPQLINFSDTSNKSDFNSGIRECLAALTAHTFCDVRQCSDFVPLFENLRHDESERVREEMSGSFVRKVCRAGSCSEVFPAALDFVNDTSHVVRSAFAESIGAICEAGLCQKVVSAILQLADDKSSQVRVAVAKYGIASACLQGEEICKQIFPAFEILCSSRSRPDPGSQLTVAASLDAYWAGLLTKALADAAPAICAAGSYEQAIPLLDNMTSIHLGADGDYDEKRVVEAALKVCRNVKTLNDKNVKEAAKAREAAQRASDEKQLADQRKQQALGYLKGMEREKVKAEVLQSEAVEAKKMAMDVQREAERASIKEEMREEREKNAWELKQLLFGATVALTTAAVPALLYCFKRFAASD